MDKENKIVNNELEKEIHKASKTIKNEVKRNNKGIKTLCLSISATLLIGLGTGYVVGKAQGRELPATSKYYSNGKVIATVGGIDIKEKELKQRMEPMFYLNGIVKLNSEEVESYEKDMIDYIVTTELLYQEGTKQKITVSKEELSEQYRYIMDTVTQTFGMEEDKFFKKFNVTKEEVEKSLEKELIASKFMEQDVKVSDSEIEEYYKKNKAEFEQVSASHILIKTVDEEGEELTSEKKSEAKKLAEEILKRALAGENFEELAKMYSQDGSSESGGDLGLFTRGDMVDEFEKSAFSLKVGEIDSKVIETQYGYHIVKKTSENIKQLEAVKTSISDRLIGQKQSSVIEKLMEEYNVIIK